MVPQQDSIDVLVKEYKPTTSYVKQKKQWINNGATEEEYEEHVSEELKHEYFDREEKMWRNSNYKPDRAQVKKLALENPEVAEENVAYFEKVITAMEDMYTEELVAIRKNHNLSEDEKFKKSYLLGGKWSKEISERKKKLACFRLHLPPERKTSTELLQGEMLERARDASLMDVAGQYVKLTKLGDKWKGSCPFHEEKTPSFYIYDDHYHCFGCEAHGDVIRFKMLVDNISFVDAVRELTQ